MKSIHSSTAREIIASGQPCDIRLWKRDGEILHYTDAICIYHHVRSGSFRVKLRRSGQIRQFRLVTVFEVNDMEVYL